MIKISDKEEQKNYSPVKLRTRIVEKYKKDFELFGEGYNPIDYKLQAHKGFCFSIVIENYKEDHKREILDEDGGVGVQ